ncbi:MAG: transcriptional regulator, partial [Thermoplasmata archaeon]|nr:transcriptional regulator [Thermoplasmata archaeon]
VLRLSYTFTGEARRTEIWEYPLDAIREAVTNAICHRDYTSPAEIQIKIFDDEMVIWNPGPLPLGMTLEKLMDPRHNSVPRNHQIAMLFYDTALIERYGSGIERILDECKRLNFPEPEFNEYQNGFQVIFRKDIYTEEQLKKMGLNERQIKGVLYVKERGEITNREYRTMFDVTDRTALSDLEGLCERKILTRMGSGRSTKYVLSKPEINPKNPK